MKKSFGTQVQTNEGLVISVRILKLCRSLSEEFAQ